MALKFERDPVSGHQTTGHEWNGIKELNTPVPKIVFVSLALTIAFLVLWTSLMPAWPLVTTYTRGLLGVDQRKSVEQTIARADQDLSVWRDKIIARDYDAILADPALMAHVNETAPRLFGDNCAGCHGVDAKGGPGFPNIVEANMLWGSSPEIIAETIRAGINTNHDDTRYAEMLAFGRDEILTRDQVEKVVAYVRTLSGLQAGDAATLSEGATIFAENCASCHGENAAGLTDVGAPDLTDAYWIYGSSFDAIYQTVHSGRKGYMPAWQGRLSTSEIKLLVAYLTNLRSQEN